MLTVRVLTDGVHIVLIGKSFLVWLDWMEVGGCDEARVVPLSDF